MLQIHLRNEKVGIKMNKLSNKLKSQAEEYKKIADAIGVEDSKSTTIKHVIFWLVIIVIAVAVYYLWHKLN